MEAATTRHFAFGAFRLDAERRLLLCDGEPVALTPKVFDTLLVLVEHPGVLLTKEDLMATVWPDTVVEENNLGQNISKLRSALGEARGENRYIATVPGQGYRFVADVRRADAAPAVPAPGTVVVPGAPQWPVPRRVVLAVALVAVVAMGAWAWIGTRAPVADAALHQIAILPFKPLVTESRDEALELGMADALITRLGTAPALVIRPIAAVRRFAALDQDPVAAGRTLGVQAVLDGTIQRWGDRIRVTARLTRVADGHRLWTGRFDDRFVDIFGVQDSIAARVADELALQLTATQRERIMRRYTADADAYDAYLKGRLYWEKRTVADTRRAVEYFERALQRDPSYALALAGLADCHRRRPIMSDESPQVAFPAAKDAARRALQIDPELADVHATLGWIALWYDWDWPVAEASFARALVLSPRLVSAHLGLAHLMSILGRHDEALHRVDEALRLEPLSSFTNAMKGTFLLHARRPAEAEAHLRRALEVDSSFWIGQITLAAALEQQGRHADALASFAKAQVSAGETMAPRWLAASARAAAGQRDEAKALRVELQQRGRKAYVPPTALAALSLSVGDTSAAVRHLKEGYTQKDVRMIFLGVDPMWDALRSDPAFTEILRSMRLPGPAGRRDGGA